MMDELNDYNKIMTNKLNNALIPNVYLELVTDEMDKKKRYHILKKYFTENITKNLYQNMDLLATVKTDFAQFKHMYIMVARELFLNFLLAVETLVAERGCYKLDHTKINVDANIVGFTTDKNLSTDEYSICQSYLQSQK